MNQEFCERLELYVYAFDSRSERHVIVDRDWRSEGAAAVLLRTWGSRSSVLDANYGNRGELYPDTATRACPSTRTRPGTPQEPERLGDARSTSRRRGDDRARMLSYDGLEHKAARL
jgi:hypothetical protein